MVLDTNTFSKTICSICYEDLKPIVEDLQAVSVCGHVFHELCLQQWFEYSSKAKKCSCPVCKQSCSGSKSNLTRLYFQSVGDVNESIEPLIANKVSDCKEDLQWLQIEVKRLEAKASNLTSVVDSQGKEIKQLNEELCHCKDQLKQELKLRNATLEQKALINLQLIAKSQELDALKVESLRLQERNMALAKELAALKLVSNLDLDEDEILKLASFGNEDNNKETIDILKRSLVIRNKSYKELIAKCNELGRGEARSSKRLEKAKEKISKLKTKVQELETISEVNNNEVLRTLKTAKKLNGNGATLNGVKDNSNAMFRNKFSSDCQEEKQSATGVHLVHPHLTTDHEIFEYGNGETADSNKESRSIMDLKGSDVYSRINKVASKHSTAMHLHYANSKHSYGNDSMCHLAKMEAVPDTRRETSVNVENNPGVLSSTKSCINIDKDSSTTSCGDEEVIILDDPAQVQPVLNIRNEYPSSFQISKPGSTCFSSGLLGPNGTNRYLGKWCKRGQNNGSLATQGRDASSGDLIAVGSDGRGGKVKVLRSLNRTVLDGKENSVTTKRCKSGDKADSSQSKGYLKIEHFFARAGQ